ncbi:hypothetical protein [Streptomyces sp. NPDC001833]|uniref:hypothetical protein n=1 Tax=Streptomyces sp. NPDC001833 TaxID=3154658 RepID=UPI00332BC08F
MPLAAAHAIELLGTLPVSAIDPRQIGAGAYHLTASTAPAAVRPHLLLAEILARRDQAVIVKCAVRGDRERIGLPPADRKAHRIHTHGVSGALGRKRCPAGRRELLGSSTCDHVIAH